MADIFKMRVPKWVGLRQHIAAACRETGAIFPAYYFSSLVVVLGVVFGYSFVPSPQMHPAAKRETWSDGFLAWDGMWYQQIASEGYNKSKNELEQSNLNFYPAYPVLAGSLSWATNLPVDCSLLLLSHGFLIAALALFGVYLRRRAPTPESRVDCVLLTLCLFPTSFYYRMAYTESAFLFGILLFMVLMQRGVSVPWLALVVGTVTALRPTGIALILPWLIQVWRTADSRWQFVSRSVMWSPLLIWGLAGYMCFQWVKFGDALEFVKASANFMSRPWPTSTVDHLIELVSLEPIWTVYDASSVGYWGRFAPNYDPSFNMQFANPLYFLFAVALICVGAYTGWLSFPEIVLGSTLLLVPYALNGYRSCMAGQARYSSVVFPAFIVLGELLGRAPLSVRIGLLMISSVLLFIYSALFSSWYWFT